MTNLFNFTKDNIIQDAYAESTRSQFWRRNLIAQGYLGKAFKFDLRLENDGIGQGHVICFYWAKGEWVEIARLYDGEKEANGKNYDASTYGNKTENLLTWSEAIILRLYDIATAVLRTDEPK